MKRWVDKFSNGQRCCSHHVVLAVGNIATERVQSRKHLGVNETAIAGMMLLWAPAYLTSTNSDS